MTAAHPSSQSNTAIHWSLNHHGLGIAYPFNDRPDGTGKTQNERTLRVCLLYSIKDNHNNMADK